MLNIKQTYYVHELYHWSTMNCKVNKTEQKHLLYSGPHSHTMQQVQVSCTPSVSGFMSESISKLGSRQTLPSTLTDGLFCHSLPLPSPSLHLGPGSAGLIFLPVRALAVQQTISSLSLPLLLLFLLLQPGGGSEGRTSSPNWPLFVNRGTGLRTRTLLDWQEGCEIELSILKQWGRTQGGNSFSYRIIGSGR